MALILSLTISKIFFAGIFLYILASRAYSYRGIRLKKYPFIGYLTVIICQGALTFYLVMHGCNELKITEVPMMGMIGAALLVGGFYPLTQIYQHQQDLQDGVTTLSYKLGYMGTFIFSAIIFALAMCTIGLFLTAQQEQKVFFQIQIFFIPVLVYFTWWFHKVYRDKRNADFVHTMRMNMIASFFTNAGFIYLLLNQKT